ncbi:MAG: NADH-quinone oxidoreductase subunit NuoB [Planctomycetota bacterium]
MGVDRLLSQRGFIATRVDWALQRAVNWGRAESLWPLDFGTACCNLELESVLKGKGRDAQDLAFPVASPRQADLLIVAGTITWKMAPVLRRLYRQMLEPRYVIAFGVCSATGGMYQNYAVVPGVDQIVDVNIYVAGCPPRAEQLFDAIQSLKIQIKSGEPLQAATRPDGLASGSSSNTTGAGG